MNHGQGVPGGAGDLPDRPSASADLRGRRDDALAVSAATPEARVTIVGILRRLDVEGGVWAVELDDGAHLQLLGAIDAALTDRRLVLTGRPRPDLASTAQVGPVLEVESIGPAPSGEHGRGPE